MINVLFVCLGNICRSPLAEGIFKELIKNKGLESFITCDSAGTAGYHIGETPDPRSIDIARQHQIQLDHLGRQFDEQDFSDFDYILAMDANNLRNIKQVNQFESFSGQLELMRNYDTLGKNEDVPDPYYGGKDGFKHVYDMLLRSCEGLLSDIIKKHNLQ